MIRPYNDVKHIMQNVDVLSNNQLNPNDQLYNPSHYRQIIRKSEAQRDPETEAMMPRPVSLSRDSHSAVKVSQLFDVTEVDDSSPRPSITMLPVQSEPHAYTHTYTKTEACTSTAKAPGVPVGAVEPPKLSVGVGVGVNTQSALKDLFESYYSSISAHTTPRSTTDSYSALLFSPSPRVYPDNRTGVSVVGESITHTQDTEGNSNTHNGDMSVREQLYERMASQPKDNSHKDVPSNQSGVTRRHSARDATGGSLSSGNRGGFSGNPIERRFLNNGVNTAAKDTSSGGGSKVLFARPQSHALTHRPTSHQYTPRQLCDPSLSLCSSKRRAQVRPSTSVLPTVAYTGGSKAGVGGLSHSPRVGANTDSALHSDSDRDGIVGVGVGVMEAARTVIPMIQRLAHTHTHAHTDTQPTDWAPSASVLADLERILKSPSPQDVAALLLFVHSNHTATARTMAHLRTNLAKLEEIRDKQANEELDVLTETRTHLSKSVAQVEKLQDQLSVASDEISRLQRLVEKWTARFKQQSSVLETVSAELVSQRGETFRAQHAVERSDELLAHMTNVFNDKAREGAVEKSALEMKVRDQEGVITRTQLVCEELRREYERKDIELTEVLSVLRAEETLSNEFRTQVARLEESLEQSNRIRTEEKLQHERLKVRVHEKERERELELSLRRLSCSSDDHVSPHTSPRHHSRKSSLMPDQDVTLPRFRTYGSSGLGSPSHALSTRMTGAFSSRNQKPTQIQPQTDINEKQIKVPEVDGHVKIVLSNHVDSEVTSQPLILNVDVDN